MNKEIRFKQKKTSIQALVPKKTRDQLIEISELLNKNQAAALEEIIEYEYQKYLSAEEGGQG
ncbi:hypothetical protein [Bacillus sp. FSL K6-6540]|uniref:hypothetical protein n=1 Tax=Bacillus sp. FSL K6-6540 TaxID=2921512 RepID=UPI0030F54FE1